MLHEVYHLSQTPIISQARFNIMKRTVNQAPYEACLETEN